MQYVSDSELTRCILAERYDPTPANREAVAKLVLLIARRYVPKFVRPSEVDDAVQEGVIYAITKGLPAWRPELGSTPFSFATTSVRHGVLCYLRRIRRHTHAVPFDDSDPDLVVDRRW